jgi:dihydrofolate reductase
MSQRKVILSMQMTLDGYVAGPDGKADWLISSEENWEEMFKMLESADTFLLGRKMYPEYSAYWQSVLKNPADKSSELAFAKLAEKSPHIVFTKGDFMPDWKNTRVSHDMKEEIATLKKQPGKDIIAWGGANFASNLINLGLVDEIRIELNPTAIGGGKALFGGLDHENKFELLSALPMKSGLVILRYKA